MAGFGGLRDEPRFVFRIVIIITNRWLFSWCAVLVEKVIGTLVTGI
jgi:hypothetical protein